MRKLILSSIAITLFAFAAPLWAASQSFTDNRVQTTTNILASSTTSSEIDLGGTYLVGIQLPASFTGTSLTFTVATASGGTFQTMKDGAGNSVSKTVAQGQYIGIDPTLFRGVRFFKVVSGSTETSDRSLTVISAPVH